MGLLYNFGKKNMKSLRIILPGTEHEEENWKQININVTISDVIS